MEREIHSAVITGATGAIGTALCGCLLDHEIEVYAVVRPDSVRLQALKDWKDDPRFHLVLCGMDSYDRLPDALEGGRADAFFHLAWADTSGAGRNNMASQVRNIGYCLDAVHAAAKLGARVFIGAGSQAEYGRSDSRLTPSTPCFPENGYGMAKLCAGQMSEMECAGRGMDHIWFRVLSVYGPHDGENSLISMLIRSLRNGQPPKLTAGEQVWDYLYSEDAARAFYLAAVYGKNGAVYPLGSGETRTIREYAEVIRQEIDPELPILYGAVPYGEKQVMHLQVDISTLTRDTGFLPEVTFEEGVRKLLRQSNTNDEI